MSEEISIITELHRVLDLRPFQPFFIVMNSGERYEVTGSHQVAVGRNVIVVLRPGQNSLYLRINQISSLETPEAVI